MSSYYHTYRPQQFSDLVGQDHIRRILQTAVASDKLAHAYLFCGTRGTGKTTTARLLAKLINCKSRITDPKTKLPEPCNECDMCKAVSDDAALDVIEIDAASNRGIEEIRTLQEQLRFKPQLTDKKIIIIDEVHMLTKEAFNALLKTLEEPPAYLVFILATTETHKVPATVISRCQRFDFLTPDGEVIGQYLQRLAQHEGLKVEASALQLLANLAAGSFRDSATLLEQLATDTQSITAEYVASSLGLPSQELVDEYIAALSGQPASQITTKLENYFTRGGNASAFIDQAFHTLGRSLRAGKKIVQPQVVLAALTQVKYRMKQSPVPELPILVSISAGGPVISQASPESIVVQATVAPKPVVNVVIEEPQPVTVPQKDSVSDEKSTEVITEKSADILSETVAIPVAEQVPPAELPTGNLTEIWQKSLAELIKQDQSSMVAILRTARPLSWNETTVKIAVQFKFHADQLGRQKNRGILESALAQICGKPVRVEIDVQPAEDVASLAEELSL